MFAKKPATADVDFAQLRAALVADLKPEDARKQKIQGAYNDWFQREAARPGATLTGGAPAEVDEALMEVARARTEKARRFYDRHQGSIAAALDASFAEASVAFAAAAEAMAKFQDLQRQHRAFQHACGVPVSAPIGEYEALSPMAWREWHAATQRQAHPPAPRPQQRAEDNQLILS